MRPVAGYNRRMEQAGESQSLPLPGSRAPRHTPLNQCVISFGSNLGDRRELIAAAAKQIAACDWIEGASGLRTSRLFETPPIGGPDQQEPFLNAIGVFETRAAAGTILNTLQRLEAELGRLRRRRWDSRSIDLDVVLHGNLVGGATGLVVPHPRYTARRFVLVPACDVASHFRDPRFGWTLGELAAHLEADVPSLALATGRLELRETLCRRLSEEHGIAVRDFSAAAGSLRTASAGNDCSPLATDWVTCHVPPLPKTASGSSQLGYPRLLVRIQRSDAASAWPAPHQMWPAGWNWPEYRLEVDDEDWAVSELASAYDSMRCAVRPVTVDGCWW